MSGKAETEVVIYAKIGNVKGLDQAINKIHQEQVQVRAPRGRIRVRMERDDTSSDWEYTLTTKKSFSSAGAGPQACLEDNKPTDAQTYEMFKSVGDVFQRKTRFIFPVEGVQVSSDKLDGTVSVDDLVYEVDVFYQADGTLSEWCKIDIEVDALLAAMKEAGISASNLDLKVKLSRLPFEPQEAFTEDPNNPKTKELIGVIFDRSFNRPLTDTAQERGDVRPMNTTALARAIAKAL